MAALTAQRKIENLNSGLLLPFDYPTKATKVFYKGALTALDATGYLVPAGAVAGQRTAGVVDTGQAEKVDTTGQSDGDTSLKVQAGIFAFKNATAGDALTQAQVGKDVFVLDDQTVAKTDGGGARPVAGQLVKFETGKMWVAVGIRLFHDVANGVAYVAPTTVTSGAIPVASPLTFLSVTGTVAFTLADGTFAGQRKTLRCTVAASTPAGTLTPATPSGFATILFDAVHEETVLEWTGAAWVIALVVGATPA